MADNMADMGARMGERADEMRERAAELKERAGSAVSEYAGKAKDYASQYAGRAKDYAQQGYDIAAEKSRQLKETTQGYIEENPWYAIGIALGVGVLVGLMLRNSRD